MQRGQLASPGDFVEGSAAAVAHGPACTGRPIEVTVGTLSQRSVREGAVRTVFKVAKIVKHRHRATGSHLEQLAVVISGSPGDHSVEVPVGALHQRVGRVVSISATPRAKIVENGNVAGQGKPVGDAATVAAPATARSPEDGHPIEVAVGGLNRWGARFPAVWTVELRAKAINRRQRALGADLEDHTVAVRPACRGCPIKVPVGGQRQSPDRVGAIRAIRLRAKAVKSSQVATRGYFESRATANLFRVAGLVDAAVYGGPIQVAVEALDHGH